MKRASLGERVAWAQFIFDRVFKNVPEHERQEKGTS